MMQLIYSSTPEFCVLLQEIYSILNVRHVVAKHQTERDPFAASFIRLVKQNRVNHQQWKQRRQGRDVVR